MTAVRIILKFWFKSFLRIKFINFDRWKMLSKESFMHQSIAQILHNNGRQRHNYPCQEQASTVRLLIHRWNKQPHNLCEILPYTKTNNTMQHTTTNAFIAQCSGNGASLSTPASATETVILQPELKQWGWFCPCQTKPRATS